MTDSVFYKEMFKSPVGNLEITATDKGVRKISFVETADIKNYQKNQQVEKCKQQLGEYFRGERKQFTVDLDLQGTEFQKLVWMSLLTIPFAVTVSYMYIAKMIGDAKAVRAVGMANYKNNIPIIIPCHRVVGNSGSLTGYVGGLWRKDWLIKHEGKYSTTEIQMEFF